MAKRRPDGPAPAAAGQGTIAPVPGIPAAKPRVQPASRRLRVFSLDPSADVQLENTLISRSVLEVPWEDPLDVGPVGEYLEVVDVDPSSQCVYDPVNLNDPALLAQDGLSPSTGNPQFHQQMVYAVAMKTIANFEQVLGRRMLWAERQRAPDGVFLKLPSERYVQRLRIYPHALREQNAYYSPLKRALLFGYFNAPTTDPRDELPGGLVFTCLSHDVIAHETTHAILDGMHRRLLEPSNVDMVAFHEAFADIVAIFQHFTLPDLLLDQIQKARGNLRANSLLGRLAVQFARSTGQGDALRNALGRIDATGVPARPDPADISRTTEPHERGAILVAAVFDAFVRMYENRVADLRRIATRGTGVLPRGDIHPDLARRFANEAVRLSQRVLNICIRAIDYLPPVDVTFGDYLRALVTADMDFFPDDPKRYRLAFIEAFRDRGIYPLDVRALAEDALRWKPLVADDLPKEMMPPRAVLRTMATAYDSNDMTGILGAAEDEEASYESFEIFQDFEAGRFQDAAEKFLKAAWPSHSQEVESEMAGLGERYPRYRIERMFARFLHGWIEKQAKAIGAIDEATRDRVALNLGLDLKGLVEPDKTKKFKLEIHAVRPTVRLRPDGRSKIELMVVLGQECQLPLLADPDDPSAVMKAPDGTDMTFIFRGGSTLIVDPEAGQVTYSVSKSLLSKGRRDRQMAFLCRQLAEQGSAAVARFGLTPETRDAQRTLEPFALAHGQPANGGTY